MRFVREENGQSLLIVAVFMCVIGLGFMAFALDVGSLFRQKRMAQAAADAAAVAAAKEKFVGNSTSNEQAMANAIAKLNGFDTTLSSHAATVVLSTPSTGTFQGTGYVQATVTRSIPTVFLAGLPGGKANITVSATAIAGGGVSSPTCVCVESASSADIFMVGGSKLNAQNCGIVDDSNSGTAVYLTGGSKIDASTLGTVSTTWDTPGNINNGSSITPSTTIIQGISSSCAPTMPTPPSFTPSSCVTDPGNNGSAQTTAFTAGPSSSTGIKCYNGLTIGSNSTIDTLNPGIYVINGGYLHFENNSQPVANYGGNGVFFYLTNGATLQIDQGSNVNLVAGGGTTSTGGTAPSIGTNYDGILIYQDTSDSSAMTVAGGSNLFMNGSLFMPSAQMNFSNGSTNTIEGGIVAQQVILSGGAVVTANANASQGTVVYTNPKLVQ